MRTVELVVDDGLDRAVRDLWDRIAAAGLPSLAQHPSDTNAPHITLAECSDLASVATCFGELPITVTLDGVRVIEGRRSSVVVLAIEPSAALERLQQRVYDAVVEPAEHLAPARWQSHVSLALRVPQDLVDAVREVVGDPDHLHGRAVRARSFDTETKTLTWLTP